MFKFENLEVWNLALDYADLMYSIADALPKSEEYNLRSQLRRSATSIALNIAEGSTGQSDGEQRRFLGMALRSLIETVACLQIIRRRGYLENAGMLDEGYERAGRMARKLQAFRNALTSNEKHLREEGESYGGELWMS